MSRAHDSLNQTNWGLVLDLRKDAPPSRREQAWRHLSDHYRPAMIARARRAVEVLGGGHCTLDDAEDIVQEFLADCVEKGWLERADPAQGSFRAFVFVALARRARDYVESRRARRRAPTSAPPKSLADIGSSAALRRPAASDDETLGDWVACLVRAAVERVRLRSAACGAILDGLVAEQRAGAAGSSGEGLAPREKSARHRARVMFAKAIREEIGETTADPREQEEELRTLEPWLARYDGRASRAPAAGATRDRAGLDASGATRATGRRPSAAARRRSSGA